MRAFVMKGLGKVGFMEKPIPEPGPNDAVIKTTKALVCTSDVHTLHGAIGERKDLTLGHEGVGVIARLGRAVAGFKEGDRVAVNAITPDFRCDNCQRGYTSQCRGALGGWKFSNTKDGVFADYFHVNDAAANLAPLPGDVSDDVAVYCCDMMSTGFMGAEHAGIPLGGSAAVFGVGPVGMMAVAGARLLGAGLVIAVERVPKRQELARRFGADVIVDFSKVDAAQEILRLTGGEGVDGAIESLGAQATFEACVKATRPGGTISVVGYFGEGEFVKIPRVEWGVGMADKTIRTGLCPGGRERMMRLIRMLQNRRVDPAPMTTHRFPFDQLERALEMMTTKEDGMIKPLISFS
ncbi:MAG TPA: NAD(P)-dependent alcohol dehydrogenase [Candidatus Polarisedimenticolia bacterium]|nr:NAD(P)-dependent alcohol dehydrogenase [Candidatus Polarisedimenticolia bacterium]